MNKLFPVAILILFITLTSITEAFSRNKENMYIRVDLWSNELFVIENNKILKRYPIAAGTENTPTPIGIFTVMEKSKSWGSGFGTRKGLQLYKGKIDGIFDFQTEHAVKRFQKINGLPITGGITRREYVLLGLLE